MTDYRPLSYTDAKIQVDSAIRDGNGVRIDTNYQRKPTVYERTTQSSTSTICTLIQFNASDYKANGYLAHFRFRVRSVLQNSNSSDNELIINYSYRNASIICINNKGTGHVGILQYIFAYYPNSDTYIDIGNYFIAFTTDSSSTDFIIEMIEADVPYTIPATMSASTTTNTSRQSLLLSNYASGYPLMWTGNATGDINGNANSAAYSYYSRGTRQNCFRIGESDLYRLMAVDHTGVAYKINTSTKKFPLPISMYVGSGSSANTTSYFGVTSIYGDYGYTSVSYLTDPSYNGFTMPTLTTSDGGKTLFVRGSLDVDGYFVCDGNVTLSMEAGYTYIPFGTLDPKYSGSTAQVPDKFSFNAISVSAYTFDASGKLTHVDGKEIGSGVNSIDWANVQNKPIADSSTLGIVKTGYTTSGQDYKVDADANGNLHVSVPWTDQQATQELTSSDSNHPILMSGTLTSNTQDQYYLGLTKRNNSIYANPSTGIVTATGFAGNLTGNVTGNVSGSSGSCIGNSATATTLETARTINGTSFDGSDDILTIKWGVPRYLSIVNYDGTGLPSTVSVDGSADVNLKLPATIKASLTGNSDTATTLKMKGSASNTTLPTEANVTMYNGTILSQTGVWIIETYLSGNYGFQRATSLADASNVAVRTRNNSATWGSWTYSYAVWKA